jgi:uncharacterized membrane protein YecN with MAPEG domain
LASMTAIYAALLAIIGVVLGERVGLFRLKAKVSLGDGGNSGIIVRNRQHMNFVENVPMALILIALVEVNGGSATWVHSLGGSLLAARLIHPFGLNVEKIMHPARIIGAGLTSLVILAAAGKLLWIAFGI